MAKGIKTLSETIPKIDFPGEVYVLDATKAFDAVDGQCFIDEVHLNDLGNQKLSDFIATTANAEGLKAPEMASR